MKIKDLCALAAGVPDGASICFGGSFLQRVPLAFVRELVRRGTKDLEVIKPSPGYDLDILCRTSSVRSVRAGIVLLEGGYGFAPWYRKAVEEGHVELEEHACMTLVAGLRAAAYGVPFQPVAGVEGSDLMELNAWAQLADPYGSNKAVTVIPAIKPDIAVVHAHEVDELGNARVFGTSHWDRIMSRAAKRVLLTAERLVPTEEFRARPELTLIPGFMVEAVAIVPHGAWPGSVFGEYDIDAGGVDSYLAPGEEELRRHLASAPEARSLIDV